MKPWQDGIVAGVCILGLAGMFTALASCPPAPDSDLEAACTEVRTELHKAHAAFLTLPAAEQNQRRAEHVRMLGEGLLALRSCPKEKP